MSIGQRVAARLPLSGLHRPSSNVVDRRLGNAADCTDTLAQTYIVYGPSVQISTNSRAIAIQSPGVPMQRQNSGRGHTRITYREIRVRLAVVTK